MLQKLSVAKIRPFADKYRHRLDRSRLEQSHPSLNIYHHVDQLKLNQIKMVRRFGDSSDISFARSIQPSYTVPNCN